LLRKARALILRL
ncbi:Signal recognition particle receptor FtsY, partial [Haemophilus influenzae]